MQNQSVPGSRIQQCPCPWPAAVDIRRREPAPTPLVLQLVEGDLRVGAGGRSTCYELDDLRE